jgi:flagellar basal body rod protein FlgC
MAQVRRMDPISTARYGLMAASQRFESAATHIAGMRGDDSVEVAGEIVDIVQAKHAFSANLTVIRFAQDMWDSLLKLQTDK